NTINIFVKLEKVYTENKYKYIITGLLRPLDIFMVNSVPTVINKFHLSCVRAWYNGRDLNVLPSFIIAAMTSINLDIRWVSCNKDLRDIIMKYFHRGFGTALNSVDRSNLYLYISKN